MAKMIDTAFKAYCEQKRNSLFAVDLLYCDGRNTLQTSIIRRLHKQFLIRDIFYNYYLGACVHYVVTFTTGYLVKFLIYPDGKVTLKYFPPTNSCKKPLPYPEGKVKLLPNKI